MAWVSRRDCARGTGAATILWLVGGLLPLAADAQEPAGPASSGTECESDAALSDAAASLAQSADALLPDRVVQALRQAGSDLPAARVSVAPVEDVAREAAWLEALSDESDGVLVCGRARVGATRVLVAAARGGRLMWLGSTGVRGDLSPGFRDPMLVLERADDSIERKPISLAELRAGVILDEGEEPPVRMVQLLATGPIGPRPVAVLHGRAASELASMRMSSSQAMRNPLETATALRRASGSPALRSNRLLERAADSYVRIVAESGRVAHFTPEGLGPEERLRGVGLDAALVGEVVACGADLTAAWDAILASPAHRVTLFDRRFTDVGAAQAPDAPHRRQCVVVLLAAWPRTRG